MNPDRADIAIVGAGAAGLMAAIWAGRTARAAGASPRIVALDGAKSIGAKILIAGGGRCNVTHDVVDESAYAGSTRPAIRNVLRRFDVPLVVEFFRELGVELKREDTGKLFPTTDRARTVLDALLRAASHAGAEVLHPRRVTSVRTIDSGFEASGDWGALRCARLILATGGQSLPKTGSDGAGYDLARALGHTVTQRILPALAPLVVDPARTFIPSLSGLSTDAALEVRAPSGKRLAAFTGPTLCTHMGLSGPAPMDISRYLADARLDDPASALFINWLPSESPDSLDRALAALGRRSPGALLGDRLPERLARALCAHAGVDPSAPGYSLTRDARRALARAVCDMPAPVTGDRGFQHAEATAGGVPLSELDLRTMESRVTPGLHVIGEVCDVDGRIGGYNFQWAWASGYVAGVAAALPWARPAPTARSPEARGNP